ncbi:MAG TPA: DUF302 domain-containing protein [Acetobacteraceae bacterium]|nr:DUF302 domain-containing protein [Acetobacteraceae bacterium]
MNETGLITLASEHGFTMTLERLQEALRTKGVTVFALFDHAAGAADAGLSLLPTTVVVFGNPAAGTPLMQESRIAGIDLPLKVLVWEEGGRVWLTYNDPHWIAARHRLVSAAPAVAAMAKLLAAVVGQAVAA